MSFVRHNIIFSVSSPVVSVVLSREYELALAVVVSPSCRPVKVQRPL